STGGIRLGITVHEEGWHFGRSKGGGQVDGRGRFADPTLLVGDCDDFTHVPQWATDGRKLEWWINSELNGELPAVAMGCACAWCAKQARNVLRGTCPEADDCSTWNIYGIAL